VVDPKLDAPGGGLSVQTINGKIEGEDRGKQDEAQKATTSPGEAAIGKKGVGKGKTGSKAVGKRTL
jgi:Mn-containing catalase